jgi:ABC-type transport system substrate-binding protein
LLKYKLKGTVALSNGMFSTAFPKMHTDRIVDDYNPDLAKKLLQEAGYKKNKSGWLEKDGIKKSEPHIDKIFKGTFPEDDNEIIKEFGYQSK